MKHIHSLSPDVIAKIAAGEVIERPVYAVKELVENALDAGATSVTVEIEESGLKRITVIDNGKGMNKEDLQESYKPHTTSKLQHEEELYQMTTLGFRGEALASIAAIAHLTIASRFIENTSGNIIELRDGKVIKFEAYGMPIGTNVTVRNLFANVPGRKKFLKSPQTELRHIVDYLTRMALLYPRVHFSLSNNKRVLFDLPAGETIDRVEPLFGKELFSQLLPISFSDTHIQIEGFITKPQAAIATHQKQHLAINKRSISDKQISAVIKEAYGAMLESTAYPMYFLEITVPPHIVDVNVHPRKETVRFSDMHSLLDAIQLSAKQTLGKYNIAFQASARDLGIIDSKAGTTNTYAGRLLKEKRLPWSLQSIFETSSENILQLHKLYLLTQTKFGFVVVDQHAAHERILFEQFSAMFTQKKKAQPQYILPEPLLLTFSLSDSEVILEHQELFQKLGFTLEHFQKNNFTLQAVPLLFQDRKPQLLLQEIVDDLRQEKKPKEIDKISHRMIAYLACRGAVKAGDPLSQKQMKELIEKLEQTPNNATCPHGRPTRVEIGKEKLGKLFKRK